MHASRAPARSFPHGESGADVYDRVSTWFESLFRDMQEAGTG